MKLLYIIPNHNMSNECDGVTKKIYFQRQAFKNLSITGKVIFWKDDEIIEQGIENNNTRLLYSDDMNLKEKIRIKKIFETIMKLNIIKDFDCVYIRYPRSSKSFVNFLDNIRFNNNNIKIYLEIVTYPYDKEEIDNVFSNSLKLKSKLGYILRIVQDRIYRKKLRKYVNRIITFSEDENIFKVPTIRTSNGISKEIIGCYKNKNKDTKILNIIGVGGIAKYHGYDRVIRGIKNYIKGEGDKNIIFHIVGDGAELKNLKEIVKRQKLNDNVKFYGYLSGDKLERIYSLADIAIASIGRHRNKIYQLADLKSREYCAKGIPFIKTVKDLDFEDFRYCLNIRADESDVDINEIIKFYEKIEVDENFKEKMYDYALNYLTWESKLKCIL
ncbi:glycosyltransferase [Clostridium butyricum]|uniref:Glycosyltransferase family 4 protein n=3 Tax=Clostridium butyricum TaxID=1492 RepID=A0AAP9UEN1_CLOBU|nr:glycosyltransferase [Clostridium butyricum]MBZ5747453.1 glycosyltransferase [Clostridium butyricum]MDI9208378.1 glycosyltransferase [Clostridium butyricum]QMW91528.1 glycosyltransferase family 4 protein [Clostridium butyricum]BBK76270.1 glycosyl transferase [Clostridium butyricum]GEQ26383.1 glycosyl transferase [Clostridium butyricum]